MERKLTEAAQSGDINILYELLRLDPALLDKFDKPSFMDTPLHTAAAAGSTASTHFALEVLSLKPSFGVKLNPDGYTPLDLALQNRRFQTVKRLIQQDPELIRGKGRERYTPLHHVAEVGNADLLADFLVTCPKSIQDLTIRGETAVHIAVRNMNVRALQVLLGWLQRTNNEKILNKKDDNGDTVLHVAASKNQLEVVRLLINKVKINEKNLHGLTCLDTFTGLATAGDQKIAKALRGAGAKTSSALPPVDTLADILSSKESLTRKAFRQMECDVGLDGLSSEMRNALLVVAVLIATATYQAVLSPPGGISSGGDTTLFFSNSSDISPISDFARKTKITESTGKVQMGEAYFYVFITLNTVAFAASLGIIFSLLPTSRYNLLLFIPLLTLLMSYTFSITIIAPHSRSLQMHAFYPVMIGFGLTMLIMRCKFPEFLGQAPNRYRRDQMERDVIPGAGGHVNQV
ncbi:ankyrin repeat-containing protein BDA1-like isoform X1 [Coffea eugenioides]|uniref:ankyrin repeat-containing protein BDA1-like isoform X1 n=1 Tax=Coffea eugenioides TaxID=49369 RepID=UPI000F613E61|nr:ankyrin repeat-containing protein BDA1-like isoform X1 [Coffea eugenioides]